MQIIPLTGAIIFNYSKSYSLHILPPAALHTSAQAQYNWLNNVANNKVILKPN